jgi:hypothetical protein
MNRADVPVRSPLIAASATFALKAGVWWGLLQDWLREDSNRIKLVQKRGDVELGGMHGDAEPRDRLR